MGRKLHKADRAFSQWCKDTGFGDMRADARTAAMWWASEVRDGHGPEVPEDITHPENIRRWVRDNPPEVRNLPEDLKSIQAPQPAAPVLAQRDAEKVAKLVQRAWGKYVGEMRGGKQKRPRS